MTLPRTFSIILVLLLSLAIVPVISAQDAESPYNSITFTESYLNQKLGAAAVNTPNINSLYFDLQPGQVTIVLSGTNNRNRTYTLSVTMVPSVTNGQINWTVTSVKLDNLVIDISRLNTLNTGGSTDALGNFFNSQSGNNPVESFTVTDNDATLTWLRQDVNGPVAKIVDQYLYLIYTEAKINQLPWVVNPTGQDITNIMVDLQPGQGVIHAVTQSSNQNAANLTFYLTPVVVNGHVQWTTTAAVDTGVSPEMQAARTFAGAWDAFFSAWTSTSNMIDATITDNTATFVWDTSQEWADPTVVSRGNTTITASEAELNDALSAIMDSTASSLSVDLQPGQVVFSGTSTGQDGTVYTLMMTLVPQLVNGDLSWEITNVIVNGTPVDDLGGNTPENDIAKGWQRAFSKAANQGAITDITITDDSMRVTISY
ncbi:MAG: hypothetical protein H6672_05555 [Anaerolineaceae bacterium]|nr:hypothetical protein [Anaerolineaceae bacterium]